MSRRIARRNAKKLLEQQMEEMNLEEENQAVLEQKSSSSRKIYKDKVVKKKIVKNNTIPTDSDNQFPTGKVLELYSSCFADQFEDLPLLNERIQEVKQELYNRDYLTAFGNEINRESYVVRWSPSRSLAYSSLFVYLDPIRELITDFSVQDDIDILSIGGGAGSELVAFGSCFGKSRDIYTSSTKKLNLKLVDIANWSSIVDKISNYVNENWIYKEHITSPVFNTIFEQLDILQDKTPELTYPPLKLITMLFTTNELFKENKSLSINLLQNFNKFCSKGCLLLITESAGSYSEIEIGSKKFPIQFLVDTMLCGKPGENSGHWDLIDQNDSIWYRLENDLQYDLKLENMRCFYRLYRKR